jgi:hypothetical protein
MWPLSTQSKVRFTPVCVEWKTQSYYIRCRHVAGGLHAAAMVTRRNSDDSDASAPSTCVGCRCACPEATSCEPGIDIPFTSSGSFGLASTPPGATTRWLWRETRPRSPHGAVPWPGGPSSLSDRSELPTLPSSRHLDRQARLFARRVTASSGSPKLENSRSVATRYDKLVESLPAFIIL